MIRFLKTLARFVADLWRGSLLTRAAVVLLAAYLVAAVVSVIVVAMVKGGAR